MELEQAGQLAAQSGYAAVMAAYDGKVFFTFGEVSRNYLCHSIRKPFLSALYGIHLGRGALDLDATMEELNIDDSPPSLTQEEKQATVRDLLKARSGVYHEAAAEAQSMKPAVFLVLFMLCVLPLMAQQVNELNEANEYFADKKWREAITAYQNVVKAEPQNGFAWFRLGASYYQINEFERSIEAYLRSVEIAGNPSVMYNLGCSFSRNGQKEETVRWLEKSVQAGFSQVGTLTSDTDLDPVRSDERFGGILSAAQKNAKPCASDPRFRQFDFWIGEWEDKNPAGQVVGQSSIELIEGDCVIYENYRNAAGYSGRSFNVFNKEKGKWQQFWVDNRGAVLEFSGELVGKELRYTGVSKQTDGIEVLHKLTVFDLSPTTLRQLWEQSKDGGSTWQIVFDGMYHRKT